MSPSLRRTPACNRAVAVCDEGRLGIEPVRHSTAGTVTGVLLVHVVPPLTAGASLALGLIVGVDARPCDRTGRSSPTLARELDVLDPDGLRIDKGVRAEK